MGATVIQCIIAAIIGGTLFGFGIGFVPIYSTFFTLSRNCTHFTGEAACHSVHHSECNWVVAQNTTSCQFTDRVDCSAVAGESNCSVTAGCFFDYGSKVCTHDAGWGAVKLGVFAGGMIVGGTIGAITAHWVADSIGRRKTFYLLSAMGLLATTLFTVAHTQNVYWLLIVGRLLYGIDCGMVTVVVPLYVGEMAPERYRESLSPSGSCGQLFWALS
jgi:hypothetical protein